jgi:hypothetical protein
MAVAEAEGFAQDEARALACGEPVMRLLQCITVREADEAYGLHLATDYPPHGARGCRRLSSAFALEDQGT